MKQKTNRSNKRSSGSRENANINMRSVSNNREVSRRSKGKNRYSYEEERRDSSRYYEDDYYLSMYIKGDFFEVRIFMH